MEYVDLARAESERGELVLRERRDENAPPVLELRANGLFVMDTLETSSERALATEALALVEHPTHVLVGGLGLGYTMHEVLADSRVEQCTVVEIEQALVDWMRDGTVPNGAQLLADDRVRVRVADVADGLREAPGPTYDLVLLDVDNGPGNLVHQHNAALYRTDVLGHARAALHPGGVLAVWSADRAPGLQDAMREVFGNGAESSYDVALQQRSEQYHLYASTR